MRNPSLLAITALLVGVHAYALAGGPYHCNGDGYSWDSQVPCPSKRQPSLYHCNGDGHSWDSQVPCPNSGGQTGAIGGSAPAASPSDAAPRQPAWRSVDRQPTTATSDGSADRTPLSREQCAELKRLMLARQQRAAGSGERVPSSFGDTYSRRCAGR